MFFRKKIIQTTPRYNVFFKKQPYHKEYSKRKINKKKIVYEKKPFQSRKNISNPRVKKVKQINLRNKIFSILLLLVLTCIIVLMAYSVYKFITTFRGGTTIDNVVFTTTFVEGINSVPIYPHSEFIYKDRKNDETVLKMLNQGISAYRLPRGTKSLDVYAYYEENLPNNNWTHISTIQTSTEDKLFGQYWVKEEKGLRIYVENNDVWYETITKTESNNALTERRAQEILRKRILETSAGQKLLPDFPWQMEIPREYLTRYASTDMGELQSVELYELGGERNFLIYPIGINNEGTYDQMLHDFFTMQSEVRDEKWSIINTKVGYVKEREALIANLLIENEDAEGIVLMNRRNSIVYAIIANRTGEEFFEYIIENLQDL